MKRKIWLLVLITFLIGLTFVKPGQVLADEKVYTVRAGDTLTGIARRFEVPLRVLVAANEIENPDLIFVGQRILIPEWKPETPPQLIHQDGKIKKIVVDLFKQVFYAYEGGELVFSAPVSTGLAWYPTPLGTYRIYVKILRYKMEGGDKDKGTYYYLANVPHIQYFWKGYGLHGAYWHNNFGTPMSRGCVNLSLPDAEWLFNWTDPVLPEGTSVVYAMDDNPGTLVIIQE